MSCKVVARDFRPAPGGRTKAGFSSHEEHRLNKPMDGDVADRAAGQLRAAPAGHHSEAH